jgi:hypothetical protein
MGATIKYDNTRKGWVVRGKDGKIRLIIGEDKVEAYEEVDSSNHKVEAKELDVGAGTVLTKVLKLTGTIPAVTIGTGPASAVVTLTGMTGVKAGDAVTVTPKGALDDKVALAGAYVPGDDAVVLKLTNPDTATALTTTAVGVDVLAARS